MKHKRWMLGRIKFIAELFKLSLVPPVIIFRDCIPRLVKMSEDELVVESLAQLLTTAGKQLEKEKEKLDKVFEDVKKIKARPGLSSRVRFKLVDLLELRDAKWVERNQPIGPRKIAEIREQAPAPAPAAAPASRSYEQTPRGGGGRGGGGNAPRNDDRRSSGRGSGGPAAGSRDGNFRPNNTQRPGSARPSPGDMSKLGQLSSQTQGPLGPPSYRGSESANAGSAPIKSAAVTEPKNSFAALEKVKTPEEIMKTLCAEDGENDEATECVAHLESEKRELVVGCFFRSLADIRTADVGRVSQWFGGLAKSHLIMPEPFLNNIPVEELDDISEDVPKVFEYLANLLAMLVKNDFFTLAVLSAAPLKELSSSHAVKVLSVIAAQVPPAALARAPADLLVATAAKLPNPTSVLQALLLGGARDAAAKVLAAAENKDNTRCALAAAVIKTVVAQTTAETTPKGSVSEAEKAAELEKVKELASLLTSGAELSAAQQGPVLDGLHACNEEFKCPANFVKRWLEHWYEVDVLTEEGVAAWVKTAQNKDLTRGEAEGWLADLKEDDE